MTTTIIRALARSRNSISLSRSFETAPLPMRLPPPAAFACPVDASSTCRVVCVRLHRR